jgi:hypothetical protein
MNNFLALGMVAACGWVASNVVRLEPAPRPAAPRPTTIALPEFASEPMVDRNVLEARRAPVPLVRSVRPSAVAPRAVDALTPSAEQKAQDEQKVQDDLDRRAARTAVEADGYKRVTLAGKASNGSWRAKAYRGTTEVWLTVDGAGRVSLE